MLVTYIKGTRTTQDPNKYQGGNKITDIGYHGIRQVIKIR